MFESIFGTGVILAGTDPTLKQPKVMFIEVAYSMRSAVFGKGQRVNLRVAGQKDVEQGFPFLDEIGMEPPARCGGCRRCQECTARAQKFSTVEAEELVAI